MVQKFQGGKQSGLKRGLDKRDREDRFCSMSRPLLNSTQKRMLTCLHCLRCMSTQLDISGTFCLPELNSSPCHMVWELHTVMDTRILRGTTSRKFGPDKRTIRVHFHYIWSALLLSTGNRQDRCNRCQVWPGLNTTLFGN
jgi:hypothetical protein